MLTENLLKIPSVIGLCSTSVHPSLAAVNEMRQIYLLAVAMILDYRWLSVCIFRVTMAVLGPLVTEFLELENNFKDASEHFDSDFFSNKASITIEKPSAHIQKVQTEYCLTLNEILLVNQSL